ncbi:hypothetical protein [Undibacterium pigrum]|uniref:Uncharacterized protein n=1 Tax=Undibacterium pigrum TaxID=401470 RepID=A0A318JC16_9BURK|nr:hypothetical protein [Undibacterium pigrum]PXX44223.1 hypothetical protein DFR42_103492 [Undibacterium pigrum]
MNLKYFSVLLGFSLFAVNSQAASSCVIPAVFTSELAFKTRDNTGTKTAPLIAAEDQSLCRCPTPEDSASFTLGKPFRLSNFCSKPGDVPEHTYLFSGRVTIKGKIHTEVSEEFGNTLIFAPDEHEEKKIPLWQKTPVTFYRVHAQKSLWDGFYKKVARYAYEKKAIVHVYAYAYTNVDDRDPVIMVSSLQMLD